MGGDLYKHPPGSGQDLQAMAGDGGGAKIWIIDNQMGRCNITEWVKFELSLKKKDILLKQGREKMIISGSDGGRGNKKEINPLSIIDKPFNEKEHNTRNIISSEIGKSTAPTLATIGRMPGRLQNRTPEGMYLSMPHRKTSNPAHFQRLD
jgi:hypothetical protein